MKHSIRIERVRSVEWRPDLLFIDVDPGNPVYTRRHMATLLRRAGYGMVGRRVLRSRSRKGRHVIVTLNKPVKSAMEAVALQAALGSDRYREVCNVGRVRTLERQKQDALSPYWAARWNVLYERSFNPTRRK